MALTDQDISLRFYKSLIGNIFKVRLAWWRQDKYVKVESKHWHTRFGSVISELQTGLEPGGDYRFKVQFICGVGFDGPDLQVKVKTMPKSKYTV